MIERSIFVNAVFVSLSQIEYVVELFLIEHINGDDMMVRQVGQQAGGCGCSRHGIWFTTEKGRRRSRSRSDAMNPVGHQQW